MKIRQGFVSNSSSSSFIIGPKQKGGVQKHTIRIFSRQECIKGLDNLYDLFRKGKYVYWNYETIVGELNDINNMIHTEDEKKLTYLLLELKDRIQDEDGLYIG